MRALVPQEIELGIAAFPAYGYGQQLFRTPTLPYPYMPDDGIMLPMSPVNAIISINYDDGAGNVVTLDASAFYLDDFAAPPVVYPAPGTTWPQAQLMKRAAVRIRYACGYSLAGDSPTLTVLPYQFKAAMLLVLGHLYNNRENTSEVKLEEIPLGAASLMRRYSLQLGIA